MLEIGYFVEFIQWHPKDNAKQDINKAISYALRPEDKSLKKDITYLCHQIWSNWADALLEASPLMFMELEGTLHATGGKNHH